MKKCISLILSITLSLGSLSLNAQQQSANIHQAEKQTSNDSLKLFAKIAGITIGSIGLGIVAYKIYHSRHEGRDAQRQPDQAVPKPPKLPGVRQREAELQREEEAQRGQEQPQVVVRRIGEEEYQRNQDRVREQEEERRQAEAHLRADETREETLQRIQMMYRNHPFIAMDYERYPALRNLIDENPALQQRIADVLAQGRDLQLILELINHEYDPNEFGR